MSQSVPRVRAQCSAKTAASSWKAKAAPKPMAAAMSRRMRQSGRASPGAGRAVSTRWTRRSEVVIAPVFSGQVAAGRTTSAKGRVSLA